MRYVVCYDISDDRRRRRVARILEGYGQRLQESAFALTLRPAQHARLCKQLEAAIDPWADRIDVWPLCDRDYPDIIHLGNSGWPEQAAFTVV